MSQPANVWIIDDDRSIRWVLERALAQPDLEVETFERADQAEASFVAPDVSEQEVLTFKLTVSDGELNASAQVAGGECILPSRGGAVTQRYGSCAFLLAG